MLTRGLGIPGRGAAWLAALPAAEAPALGVLSLATKSGRGGTTGRAAGWPASGRAPEGAAGRGGAAAGILRARPQRARAIPRGAGAERSPGAAAQGRRDASLRPLPQGFPSGTADADRRESGLVSAAGPKGSPPGPAAVWLKEERDGPARRWPPGLAAAVRGGAAGRGAPAATGGWIGTSARQRRPDGRRRRGRALGRRSFGGGRRFRLGRDAGPACVTGAGDGSAAPAGPASAGAAGSSRLRARARAPQTHTGGAA